MLLSILSGSSFRALADTILVGVALLSRVQLSLKRLAQIAAISLGVAGAVVIIGKYGNTELADRYDRVSNVNQITDPSAAIRKFRLDAAIAGTKSNAYAFLFGYGFSNSALAIRAGYDDAFASLYILTDEINDLRTKPDGLVYSLPVKIFAEHGLIGLLVIYGVLFSRKYFFQYCILLIATLQFDSWALYTIWLYIFIVWSDNEVNAVLPIHRNKPTGRQPVIRDTRPLHNTAIRATGICAND